MSIIAPAARIVGTASFLALLATPLLAQKTAEVEPAVAQGIASPLTIKSIMRGPELIGQAPRAVRWTDDSKWFYFRWLPGGGEWTDSPELYRVPAEGGEPQVVPEEEADSLGIFFAGGALSPDRRQRVTSMGGDLYVVDRRSMTVTQVTETRDGERSPRFSADGEEIYFREGDNLFSIAAGSIRQLTDIRSGRAPSEEGEAEGQKGFLEIQQEELFEHIRNRKARSEEMEALRERRDAEQPKPLYVPEGERVGSLNIDPRGRYVAVSLSKPAPGATRTIVPAWVTETGYTEDLTVRTKVGDQTGDSRIGILTLATGEVVWLDLTPEEGEGEEKGPDTDLSTAYFAGWSDSGEHGLVKAISYDYEDGWIYSVDAATGELTLLETVHDDAWIAGPCSFGCEGWIPGSERAYYVTEATGYAHLYAIDADGTDRRALTVGDWEVLRVSIPEDRSRFHLHTNEGSPFSQHFHRMDFDGSDRTRITEGVGFFQVTPSPDGERLAVIHSRANRPSELYLAENGRGIELDQITVSPTAEWLTFPWIEPEIIHFPAQDGVQVPARIYRPSDVGAQPNGAAVVFVHGAGYLHNVHNYWSSYYREYMFNHFLAANGYTVLDIDYRGSAGYGRDWRTAIYRWMGGKDLSDQVDGVRYMVEHEGVDPARVGLYGGSYGGFITLMALFTEPDVFTAGGALRSVTDWAHYNHGYTSRILNLPQEDEEAYRKSSPIYFAEGFKGHLLMAHGMVDTNVHFSDVVRLAQRLIELGKENWEMAVYPVESHGFQEPTSWTDEYRRIFELFERTIGNGLR